MTKTKQRNNHARTKRKRKELRAKNFGLAVFTRRAEKKQDAGGNLTYAEGVSVRLKKNRLEYDIARRMSRTDPPGPNQRQKRKRWRQNPHTRKKR
jgi:hypothetical protein